LKANGLGIFDMSGNVWEWCEDAYDAKAYGMHPRYDPFYNKGWGTERVMRGGAFGSGSGSVRTRVRSWGKADLGFNELSSL
jgi:formylglycine-generating enzyme required for sulfatase activity